MAKAMVFCVESGRLGTPSGMDLDMNVAYGGPDVPIGVQTDRIVVNVLYNDTLAQMASKIITEVVNIGLDRWGFTVARTDVLIPTFTWGT